MCARNSRIFFKFSKETENFAEKRNISKLSVHGIHLESVKRSNKSDLLDIFWKLSDQREPARIEAASRILTTVR